DGAPPGRPHAGARRRLLLPQPDRARQRPPRPAPRAGAADGASRGERRAAGLPAGARLCRGPRVAARRGAHWLRRRPTLSGRIAARGARVGRVPHLVGMHWLGCCRRPVSPPGLARMDTRRAPAAARGGKGMKAARTVRLALVGVGNCASSLVQGVAFYRHRHPREAIGLMHWKVGGYGPSDLQVVAAFDVDRRKVGRDVAEAIFAPPNCTTVFCPDVPPTGTLVRMGRVLDGIADHMRDYSEERSFQRADPPEPDRAEVVRVLRATGAEVVANYLPVGSEQA